MSIFFHIIHEVSQRTPLGSEVSEVSEVSDVSESDPGTGVMENSGAYHFLNATLAEKQAQRKG